MENNNGVIIYVEQDQDDVKIMQEVFEDLALTHELIVYPVLELAFQYLTLNIEKPFLIICDIDHRNNNSNKLGKLLHSDPEIQKKYIPFVFFSSTISENIVNDAYADFNIQGFFQKGTSYEKILSDIKAIVEYWERSIHPAATSYR
ncbi:MAG: hypothetical protein ABIO04_09585 [Ferruginibacter sp.]